MTIHLSILLWLPAAAALLGLLVPGVAPRVVACSARWRRSPTRSAAIADFDRGARGLQYVTDEIWICQLGIHYKLGIDGLNLFLILLTALLFLVVPDLGGHAASGTRPRAAASSSSALAETAVLGALMAQDLALFVVFFDLMLVPFLFLDGIWGPADTRIAAITKLFIYTLVGSLLMLAAAIATGVLVAPADGRRPVASPSATCAGRGDPARGLAEAGSSSASPRPSW